eukprot:maker-scaffold578_size132436-snap-gene-0.29 protein:Tk11687 transcript:maker-scaffold578_size132436-snap-gene-0.29-mRNA-1 annotation:"tyrosine-protein kinase lyn"
MAVSGLSLGISLTLAQVVGGMTVSTITAMTVAHTMTITMTVAMTAMGCTLSRTTYVAKETYTPMHYDANDVSDPNQFMLAIKRNDILYITEKVPPEAAACQNEIEKFGDRILYMKNRNTKKKGFVPMSYCAEKGSLECEPWYFGHIGRVKAQNFLSYPVNNNGAFLIRESDKHQGDFGLSVKVHKSGNTFGYDHYLIKLKHGEYFISEEQKFGSLKELAEAAESNALQGLPMCLTAICQKPRPTPKTPFSDGKWLINRDELSIPESPISKGNFGQVYKASLKGNQLLANLETGFRLPMPNYSGTTDANKNAIHRIMLACWMWDPDVRPAFDTLQYDFENFDCVVEGKYAQNSQEYMKAHEMNNCAKFMNPKPVKRKKKKRL